mmetsp:Transcript_15607/g.21577  ORF Transcript_15607/g.21577 Transcript_15607/m.21577 type:complete len:169 (+) Transcript_15607:208-714(+)|eukprot:CAMPEP_0196590532 /NCGR_PEP_ID=MMETSP1081-20130531/66880_1 /TAXON_ID=36882 /ORGANISM="Pyramimonas amylifera, Strain CCMP720" /LENGTH=168 /DNA_ID=CAMNT_0041913671 /DNA_START=186 /DNA_END=692 /DNA_ORIENTATION=+
MAPSFEQLEAVRRRIKDAFSLFELETKDKRGMVDEREIPTIIRSLGVNPTQDQLRDLITEIRGEENTTGCVEYDRFEKVIIRILTDEVTNYKRDNEEKILRAFRAFDPENKGYIDGEFLKNTLMSRGDTFRPEEVIELLGVACDESTGNIHYEDYAEILANDGRVDTS